MDSHIASENLFNKAAAGRFSIDQFDGAEIIGSARDASGLYHAQKNIFAAWREGTQTGCLSVENWGGDALYAPQGVYNTLLEFEATVRLRDGRLVKIERSQDAPYLTIE